MAVKLRTHCALDLHHSHCVFEAQTRGGKVLCHRDVPTERRFLREAVVGVPGPKGVVIEEGPMADWAMRALQPYVAEVIVCDPRRNRLISGEGDKTDHLDPGKLIELYRVGSLRRVHHPEHQSMMDLRAWVWAYHDQVKLVTAAKNKLKAAFRAQGLQYSEGNIYSPQERAGWLEQLPRASVRERVRELYGNLDELSARRDRLAERMEKLAERHPVARRFLNIPGYGPVRALTFLVMVDTPYRFATPQKLWRYAGLGPRRWQSGDPRRERQVHPVQYNRRLKLVARGAMEKAISLGDGNPFERMYERLIEKGVREPLARLSVARKALSVPWGMWKSNRGYDPALAG
jgi:transposase